MNKSTKYVFPVGDFISGFSEDDNNPCGYELECQRMVVRGVEYLDENPDIAELVDAGGVKVMDKVLKPMIDYMCLHEDNPKESGGQTGAMVSASVRCAFFAKKKGWDYYINLITTKENSDEK